MADLLPGRQPLPVAYIDESACIGCTICIQKCPVDAIVGASRRMHTVISAECIGCKLCIAPCPVDCITMRDAPDGQPRPDPAVVRERHRFRQLRLAREPAERAGRLAAKAQAKLASLEQAPPEADTDRRRSVIERALARARERQAAAGTPPRPVPPAGG
ncbi:MAG: RnfABCDGE type electron transport complex subunit B [bacterium]|jgi:electron transport complex protein RnfB|nr:RnfABCDGE type electron transport complex subunit B [Betaproteobacteria bacterium]